MVFDNSHCDRIISVLGMIICIQGSVIIQVESQNVKKYRLNDRTYTAFIEFNKQNCGADFVKAFGAGLVDTQVYDSSGSTGLYTHVAQRGV